jgi:hypothetical protein
MKPHITRRRAAFFAIVLCAAALIPASGALSRGDPSVCPDGWACAWTQNGFEGTRVLYPYHDGDWVSSCCPNGSGRNRFGNRRFVFATFAGPGYDRVRCLDPGENENNLPFHNVVRVGALGTRC